MPVLYPPFIDIWKTSRTVVFLNVMAVSSTFGEYVVYSCWLTFILLLARLVNYSEHGLRWNDSVAFCVE